jgi:hypothetical protein
MDAGLTVGEDELIEVEVLSDNVGRFSLEIESDQVIQDVERWYAYDSDSVFLPRDGGTFSIRLGATQKQFTRIVSLPMRAELVSVKGDGVSLAFVVNGEGVVEVLLNSANPPSAYNIQGGDSYSVEGNRMRIELGPVTSHSVSIRVED